MTTTARFQKGCAGVLLLTMVGIWAIALGSSRYGWPLYLELLAHFQRQYWLTNLGGFGTAGPNPPTFLPSDRAGAVSGPHHPIHPLVLAPWERVT
jgi:hypothetical protein